jgi:hypothetical protein
LQCVTTIILVKLLVPILHSFSFGIYREWHVRIINWQYVRYEALGGEKENVDLLGCDTIFTRACVSEKHNVSIFRDEVVRLRCGDFI